MAGNAAIEPPDKLPYLLLGATALVALSLLLPLVDALELSRTARIAAYVLVLIPLLHGLFLAARGYATSLLLALGAAAAALGVSFALLARPEHLGNDPGVLLALEPSRPGR